MKNLIISVLATFIFYTQFCEVKLPYVMPMLALMIWGLLTEVDCYIEDYKRSVKRGEHLQRRIKRAGRGI